VSQRSFTSGVWSLTEEYLSNNLEYFQVPKSDIEPIRSN
jgi:hypothetical protein